MNIEKMREEFEAWYWGRYGEAFECARDEAFELDESGIHENEHARFSFDSWQASRAAIEAELQPAWHPMSEDPPFPFTGDIFVGGKVVAGATWCAGYWKAKRGGCVDRKSVTHWKPNNPPVVPPAIESLGLKVKS